MFTQKDYNFIKMTIHPENLSVKEYHSLLEQLQKEYGLTLNEAYEVLEFQDDIVEQIIERRGMNFELT